MDYRSFVTKKRFTPNSGENSKLEDAKSELWWEKKTGEDLARVLWSTASDLKQASQARHRYNLIHARLYGNFDFVSFGAGRYSHVSSVSNLGALGNGIGNRLSLNVTASCIDTLAAKICKNKPRPTFLTSGASWVMQEKAKQLQKWADGVFYEGDVYNVAEAATLDKYIYGTCAIYVYIDPDTKRLCFERAFPDDLYVDDADGIYGNPRQLLRRRVMSRAKLASMFPECEGTIAEAKNDSEDKPLYGNSDIVEVWEGWHLPTSKGSGDGMHVIAVSSGVLYADEWKLDSFPFVFSRYRRRPLGFWGQGVAEILTGIQVALNRTMRSIDEQIRRKGKGRVYYPIGSVDPALIDNGTQSHIPYKGNQPPIQDNSSAVSQDELQHMQNLRQMAYQEVGISELSAQSKKPSGLDAAVALREFNDIETERFALEGRAYERLFIDLIKLAIDLVREHSGAGYKVRLPNKQEMIEVDWSEAGMAPEEFLIQIFPSSSLPSTPAARLQRVEELRAGGYIDIATAKQLLNFPDIEAKMTLANAGTEDVDACISMILDSATPEMPALEDYQNVEKIIERATAAYLHAKHHGAEERRLSMLRDYIDLATARRVKMTMDAQAEMQQQMMPQAPMSGGSNKMTNNTTVNMPTQPVAPPVVGVI